jgi:hypothetical protein
VFLSFLQVTGNLTTGRKVKRGQAIPDHPVLWSFLRRRVNPHAASDGGAWEPRAATVLALLEVFLCNSWIFRGLFCNFWIVYYVVRFVLNLWFFVSCKNNVWVEHSKSDVCACFFVVVIFNCINCDAWVFDKKK